MDYWKERIAKAFEDANIVATDEQINTVAYWTESAHQNYGMTHGYDCIPNPLKYENDDLRKKLDLERRKESCTTCNGRGRIITPRLHHSSDSQCWKCNGEGRVAD